jgi:hypothetical protein
MNRKALVSAKEYIAELEREVSKQDAEIQRLKESNEKLEAKVDWDKNPDGYLQDNPLWNSVILKYKSEIQQLKEDGGVEGSQSGDYKGFTNIMKEDAERIWNAAIEFMEAELSREPIMPPNKSEYLKQFEANQNEESSLGGMTMLSKEPKEVQQLRREIGFKDMRIKELEKAIKEKI